MTESYCNRSLNQGTLIQDYRLEKTVGAGNFGIVYQASNIYLPETVAIKEFFPIELACRSEDTLVVPLSSDTEEAFTWSLSRFLKEARILWDLSRPIPHPNIIQVKGFREANGTAYMIMEYAEGKPLSEIMDQHTTLPQDQIESILFPLLDGLEQIHSASILHRDLKPSNILIRSNGSPVLIDFGAAKHDFSSSSKSTMMVYTPMYAPPELIIPDSDQGPYSDIYSLGAILYRAVTGKPPNNPLARANGATHNSASEVAANNYNQNFLQAIEAAIDPIASNRPQTIAEFRNLLRSAPTDERLAKTVIEKPIRKPGITSKPRTTNIEPSTQPNRNSKTSIGKTKPRWSFLALSFISFSAAIYLSNPLQPEEPQTSRTVDRDALIKEINSQIGSIECAKLEAQLDENRVVNVSGHISPEIEIRRLQENLKSLRAVKHVHMNIKVDLHPFCEFISLLKRYGNTMDTQNNFIGLDFNKADRQYYNDDFLIVIIRATTEFNGYLYVDYVDHVGTVVHLFPTGIRPANSVDSGELLVLGVDREVGDSEQDRSYKISPPHGTNMISALVSKTPLFDSLRPEEESIAEYSAALLLAFDAIPVNDRPVVGLDFITTQD